MEMLLNPSQRAGILNNKELLTCHQLEAPEIDYSLDPRIPQTTRESTYPIPFGAFSALNALNMGQLTTFEYSLYGELNYRSNHQSGKTHYVSYRKLAKTLGTSVRYVRSSIKSLIDNGWLSIICVNQKGTRYQLVHHQCKRSETPTDKNGYACKFSVAHGTGSPHERMEAGHITHKSKTLWEYLHFRSDWKTGMTAPLSIKLLAKLLKMGKDTITQCLKELTDAGLLKRLSPMHVAGIYQLYPKPNGKPKPRYRQKHDDQGYSGNRPMRMDGEWRFSYNELWKVNVETYDIQTRKSTKQGLFRPITLGDVIPKAIQHDFDLAIKIHHQLKAALSVPDDAHSVLEDAHTVPQNAHPSDTIYSQPTQRMG